MSVLDFALGVWVGVFSVVIGATLGYLFVVLIKQIARNEVDEYGRNNKK